MNKVCLVIFAAIAFSGCGAAGGAAAGGGGSGGGSSTPTSALSTKLNGSQNLVAASSRMMDLFKSFVNIVSPYMTPTNAWAGGAGLGAIYFGEIEAVAYNYRPGQSVQNSVSTGNFPDTDLYPGGTGADWSYWVIIQSGYTASRDNVVKVGSKLDVSALNPLPQAPSDAFQTSAGQFGVDFVEVYAGNVGAVYDGGAGYQFYGKKTTGVDGAAGGDPLYKITTDVVYTTTKTQTTTKYPNGAGGYTGSLTNVSFLFARNDWFPSATVVTMNARDGTTHLQTVASASPALDATAIASANGKNQQQILESLTSQGTNRRAYGTLIVVPIAQFNGPLTVKFPTASAIAGLGSRSGETVAANNPTLWADDVQFSIMMAIDTVNGGIDATGLPTDLEFKGATVPFGLDLKVSSK